MNLRSRSFSALAMFGLLFGLMPISPVHASTAIQAGDLIRGTSFSAVYYYGEDGFRYVFPNEKTYKTWYTDANGDMDFSSVITLTDQELSGIQMGGNITYKPGVKMIKINSDPKTYAVDANGELRWVTSEDVAVGMFGTAWNTMIDDVPDGFFGNYTIGSSLDTVEDAQAFQMQFLSHDNRTISEDKGLTAMTFMDIVDMQYYNPEDKSTTITIHAGQTVMFANVDSVNHTFTADDDSWGTGTLTPLQNFVRRFSTPGTYTFHCSYHPEMIGTVIVTTGDTM